MIKNLESYNKIKEGLSPSPTKSSSSVKFLKRKPDHRKILAGVSAKKKK
jgi:hypothetical protein